MTEKQINFFKSVETYLNKMGEEALLQKRCVKWFKDTYPKHIIFHVPNGLDVKNGIQAVVRKQLGVLAGIPDLTIILQNFTFYVELKSSTGVLSKEQKTLIEAFEARGLKVYVIDNFESFYQTIFLQVRRDNEISNQKKQ